MTALEGNKLIAEFDGYEWNPNDTLNGVKGVLRKEGRAPMLLSELEYHTSWDWLMPVVEKIERCGGSFEIGSAQISWYHPGSLDPVRYCAHGEFHVSRQFEKKLGYTWQCCIQFIQWYNLQITKNLKPSIC